MGPPKVWEFRVPDEDQSFAFNADAHPLDDSMDFETVSIRYSTQHGEAIIERIRDEIHDAESDGVDVQAILLPTMDLARLRAYVECKYGRSVSVDDHFEGIPVHAVHRLSTEVELVYGNTRKIAESEGAYEDE